MKEEAEKRLYGLCNIKEPIIHDFEEPKEAIYVLFEAIHQNKFWLQFAAIFESSQV